MPRSPEGLLALGEGLEVKRQAISSSFLAMAVGSAVVEGLVVVAAVG